jgi:hypothetical protein
LRFFSLTDAQVASSYPPSLVIRYICTRKRLAAELADRQQQVYVRLTV